MDPIARGSEYLMIDDDHFDVEIFLSDFEEYGMTDKFHIERSGADAIDYLFHKNGSLRIQPPKVIFLDLHMPKINGLEFLRRIKSDEQTKGIPIVVLKSSISPNEVNECQRLGVNDYIEKPLVYEDFISTIKQILPRF